MGDAGFNRSRNRTVAGNAGSVEVIEEDYHDTLDAPGIGAHTKEATVTEGWQQKKVKKNYLR